MGMGFIACMEDKKTETVRDAFNDFKRIWMFHTDRGSNFFRHLDQRFLENSIQHSTTAGYDPQTNSMAEAHVSVMARGCKSLLHLVGARRALWAEAITFISEVRNRTKRKIDDTVVEPLLLELRENDEVVEIIPEQDRVEFWPTWRYQAMALLPQAERHDKLSPMAIISVSLGYD